MIGIVDYGAGNTGSLRNALSFLEIPCIISGHINELSLCRGLILPGVGAFGPAMEKLRKLNLVSFLRSWADANKHLLGICLGMQLLLTESEENGITYGLDFITGRITKIKNAPRAIHIGWNLVKDSHANRTLNHNGYAYFVHSYTCRLENTKYEIGNTTYGETFTSILRRGNILGVQFHPEKSQSFALNFLKRFADEAL